MDWWRSAEAVSSSFNNHSISSSLFHSDTYLLWADRLKDVSKSLFSPSGPTAAGKPHGSISFCLLLKSYFVVPLYIPKADVAAPFG